MLILVFLTIEWRIQAYQSWETLVNFLRIAMEYQVLPTWQLRGPYCTEWKRWRISCLQTLFICFLLPNTKVSFSCCSVMIGNRVDGDFAASYPHWYMFGFSGWNMASNVCSRCSDTDSQALMWGGFRCTKG